MIKSKKIRSLVTLCAILVALFSVVFGVSTSKKANAFYKIDLSKCDIHLGGTNFDYTGKGIYTSVYAKYKGKFMVRNTDYTVTFKDNVNVGKASVIVQGKGKYTGTKTLYFNINSPEKEVTIYYGNSNADGLLTSKVKVEKINAENLLKAMADKGVFGRDAAANSCVKEGNTLKLDMNKDFHWYVYSKGTAGENIIMGSLVNTFIDAFGVDNIKLTVEGHILDTGHIIYDFPLVKYPMNF